MFSSNNLLQQLSLFQLSEPASFLLFSFMDNPRQQCREERRGLEYLSKGRAPHERSAKEEVNLAAASISLNVRLRSSDMPVDMQQRALRFTRSLVDSAPKTPRPNPTHLARALKKVILISLSLFYFL